MYKKLYEIEGFDTGTKIRHKGFLPNEYIYYKEQDEAFYDQDFYKMHLSLTKMREPIWEVYEEPKKDKWTKAEIEEHIRVNVEDYGALIIVGAFFKKLYNEYPDVGLSGWQASAINQMVDNLPDNLQEV